MGRPSRRPCGAHYRSRRDATERRDYRCVREALLTLRFPDDDPRWSALLGPVSGVVARAVERLGFAGDLPPVVAGAGPAAGSTAEGARAEGASAEGARAEGATASGIPLDPALLDGPHPLDAARAAAAGDAYLCLDRWRRAAAFVIEGAALLTLPDEPHAPAWWRRARAVEAADRAAPELGILWSELLGVYAAPEAGVGEGRAGAWYARWLRRGESVAWEAPTDAAWAAFGRWVFDAAGAAAGAPAPLHAVSAPPGAWEAAPLSFRRVRVDAGAAGARLQVDGAEADPAVIVAGDRATVLVTARAGGPCVATVTPAGPVGTWELRSGRTGPRFGAARGIELQLRADGTGDVTLADAFIGPATEDALSLAAQFSVSGTLMGRWKLVGMEGAAAIVELGAVTPVGVTVHPKGRFGFAMPAGPLLGRAEGWLARMGGTRWRVRPIDEGVEASGSDLGPDVVLRFVRVR